MELPIHSWYCMIDKVCPLETDISIPIVTIPVPCNNWRTYAHDA